MQPHHLVGLALALASPALATSPKPVSLRPGAAAVVGGWTGVYRAIKGVALQRVTEVGDCLQLDRPVVAIEDHQTVDQLVINRAHPLEPGRWAVVGVEWTEGWGDRDMLFGVSRQDGDLWTFTVTANAVTHIGVWPVTSPYPHRYLLGEPERDGAHAAAVAAAEGVGPLVQANFVRAQVKPPGGCSAPKTP